MASSRPLPLVAKVLNTCHLQSFQQVIQVNLLFQRRLADSMSCYLQTDLKMPFLSSSSSNPDLEMPVQSQSQLSTPPQMAAPVFV